jgi:hypothetical protein
MGDAAACCGWVRGAAGSHGCCYPLLLLAAGHMRERSRCRTDIWDRRVSHLDLFSMRGAMDRGPREDIDVRGRLLSLAVSRGRAVGHGRCGATGGACGRSRGSGMARQGPWRCHRHRYLGFSTIGMTVLFAPTSQSQGAIDGSSCCRRTKALSAGGAAADAPRLIPLVQPSAVRAPRRDQARGCREHGLRRHRTPCSDCYRLHRAARGAAAKIVLGRRAVSVQSAWAAAGREGPGSASA